MKEKEPSAMKIEDLWPEDIYNFAELRNALKDSQKQPSVFTEAQAFILNKLIAFLEWKLDYDNEQNEDVHPDIRNKLKQLTKRFENHRHVTSFNYSSKPEG